MKKIVLTLAAVLTIGTVVPVYAASPELAKVLAQMDTASQSFTTAQADVKQDQYTKIVNETDITTGTVYFRRASTTQMAALYHTLNGDSSEANHKIVVYNGTTLQLYQPGVHQITQMSAGKNKSQIDNFLTLGFGGSGKALETNWQIKLVGMEKIDGVSVAHLDLTAKDPSISKMFSQISIWVDPVRDVSLKQVFVQASDNGQPSGDSYTANYSNIKTGISIPAKIFTLDPKALGAQVVNR